MVGLDDLLKVFSNLNDYRCPIQHYLTILTHVRGSSFSHSSLLLHRWGQSCPEKT